MTASKQHKFRVTDEMWNSFSTKCKSEGIDCSTKIRNMISNYLDGELVTNINNQDSRVKELEEVCDKIYDRCGYIPTSFFQKEGMTPILRDHMELYCTQKEYEVKVVPKQPVPTTWSEVL